MYPVLSEELPAAGDGEGDADAAGVGVGVDSGVQGASGASWV